MSLLVPSAIGAAALFGAAALPYFAVERRWRWRWHEVPAGEIPADRTQLGAYRQGSAVPTYCERAPAAVRLAAFTSLFFGQMFVPGLALGLLGIAFYGVGVVSIPGLIVAAKLYRSGLTLLRREPRLAFFQARSAVRWSLWLNLLALAIVVPSIMISVRSQRPLADNLDVARCLALYSGLSIAQALQLRAAISQHEDALFAPTQTLSRVQI
jgi:hypothetical protein